MISIPCPEPIVPFNFRKLCEESDEKGGRADGDEAFCQSDQLDVAGNFGMEYHRVKEET